MQQLIVLGALSLAFHWVAQFYCDNRLHSEFCTPSVCTCQIVWAQARKHACTFWAGRVCFPCVFANLCALDVSACARAGWGARERERFRMRCALRRVCLHHVMLERSQSVRVWDRWLALLPKVLLLFCILYLLPIRQTALRRVPTFCLFACRCAVCMCVRADSLWSRTGQCRPLSSCKCVCGHEGKFDAVWEHRGFVACWAGKWRVESAVV